MTARTATVGGRAVVALASIACSSGDDDGAAARPDHRHHRRRPDGYVSEVYADDANWLCRPGVEGVVQRRRPDRHRDRAATSR